MKEKYENVLKDFCERTLEHTMYETISVSTCDVVKRCMKCGRTRVFYCKDENFKFCDKCGRSVLTTKDLEKIYGKYVLDFASKLAEQSHLDTCRHCLHFDKDEFKCDKIHHCDCDCPECSPESYV